MSRNIRVSEPSAEMQIKIIRAKDAIASQKPRTVRCPYCRHNSIPLHCGMQNRPDSFMNEIKKSRDNPCSFYI